MSLSLPPEARRAWIASRLEPLDTPPPDVASARVFTEFYPDRPVPDFDLAVRAAVLVALIERPEGLNVLLTTRPDTMRSHAGQIAFPGGRAEPGETAAQTALREAEEEVGLPPSAVTLAGLGTPYLTGTSYLIVPVVGFAPPDLPLKPNPTEVADIFETPLEFLMDPTHHEEHQMVGATGERYQTMGVTWEDRFIWGATASMLRMLHERLFGAPRPMIESLGARPWIAAPATQAVIAALESAGGAGCVRFVGGCVRNAILGRPIDDIDLATTLTPDAVTRALGAAGLKAVPTGVEHGTVTAVAKGHPFEITTLRRDVETDGRRAVVAFTADWAEDAQRRDFRLNALYADPTGRLYDPTAGGLADARAGRIVFVGDAATRIREDALRILRFFRFQAWYGRVPPDATGLAACAALKGLIANLSAERVGAELLKLLAAEDPRASLALMAEAGVLAAVLPQAAGLARFEGLVAIETELLFEPPDPLLRLAALLPDEPAAGAAVAQRLRLSNAQRDRLEAALTPHPQLVSWLSPKEIRQLVYRLGLQAFCDRALLGWAGSERPAAGVQWRALPPLARGWTAPKFPLTGDQALAAGVPKGPLVGQVLRAVEDWWVDNDFPADHLALIERLKAVVQGMAL